MRLRVACGILAILALHVCSYPNLSALAKFVLDHHADYVDEITRYEKRFESIKGQLPDHGLVGYHADKPQPTDAGMYFEYVDSGITWRMEEKKSYLLTQYALAPVIVDRTHEYPLLVENRKTEVRVVRVEGR